MKLILPRPSTTLTLAVLLIVVASCSQEITQLPIIPRQPVTVESAKVWLETFAKSDTNKNQPYSNRLILWKQAVLKQSAAGTSYVQIPLEEEPNKKRVVYDSATRDYVLAPNLQILVYQASNAELQLRIMELAPTGDYAASHQGITGDQDYSGL